MMHPWPKDRRNVFETFEAHAWLYRIFKRRQIGKEYAKGQVTCTREWPGRSMHLFLFVYDAHTLARARTCKTHTL
jgi:hypothetical protein